MDDNGPPSAALRLCYHVQGSSRRIFKTAHPAFDTFESIHAAVVYIATASAPLASDELPPRLIGTDEQLPGKYSASSYRDARLVTFRIALQHALETVLRRLEEGARGFRVYVGICTLDIHALRLMRRTIAAGDLEWYTNRRGEPRLHFDALQDALLLHHKIEHIVGPDGIKIDYRYLGGNRPRPFFDQQIVTKKCQEVLDQLEDKYYASRRWNKVSRFIRPFDCHGWLRGSCSLGRARCAYQHRIEALATVEPSLKTKEPRKALTCKYWAQGKCSNGDACKFAHDGEGGTLPLPICRYWKQGQCFNGDACGFSHPGVAASHSDTLACSNRVQGECNHGPACGFGRDIELDDGEHADGDNGGYLIGLGKQPEPTISDTERVAATNFTAPEPQTASPRASDARPASS